MRNIFINGIRMRARIYFPAYPLIIFCILLALVTLLLALFASDSWATLSKQIIDPDEYLGSGTPGGVWLPQDATGNIIFSESLESTGYDNIWSAETIPTGGTIDEDSDEVSHSGHGSDVLEILSAASSSNTGSYVYYDYGTAAAGVVRLYIYMDYAPSINRNFLFLRNGSPTTVSTTAVRLMTMTTGALRVVIPANGGVNNKTCESTNVGIDGWYRVEISVKSIPMVHIYNDAGTQLAWTTGGSGGSNYDCCNGSVACGNNYTTDNAVFDHIVVGDTGIINASLKTFYDDIVIRSSDTEIGDFTFHGLLTDSNQNTYWQYYWTTGSVYNFSLNYANPVADTTVKGIRVWEEAKQYDDIHYGHQFGASYPNGNDIVSTTVAGSCRSGELACSNGFKKIYAIHYENPDTEADWTFTQLNSLTSKHSLVTDDTTISGAKIAEVWTEVIYGTAGDGWMTHELDFSGVTTSQIKAWVRVNEETDIRLCHDTNTTPQCNTFCTAADTPWDFCTGSGTGTGTGTATSAVTATSATDFSKIIPITGLTANTEYYIDVFVQQSDDSWLSMHDFENNTFGDTVPVNPYHASYQHCKTARVDAGTSTPNFLFGAFADQHKSASHWDYFYNLGADSPEFVLELGDQEILDATDQTVDTFTTKARKIIYERRGFQAKNVHVMENIGNKPKIRVWSDHDWGAWDGVASGYVNSSKIGPGYYGGTITYANTYKGYDLFKETQPGLDYVVDDVSLSVTTGGDANTCVVTDTIYTTGIDGIYPGMMAHLFDGSTFVGWSIVRNVSGSTIEMTQNFSAGTCANGYTLRIGRGFIGQKASWGNVDFVVGDLRKKRDPNRSFGGDPWDGVTYNFFSTTAASALSKDISCGEANCTGTGDYNDYAILLTGFSEIENLYDNVGDDDGTCEADEICHNILKHNITDASTALAKWDMVCAWDADEIPFRGCAMIEGADDYPAGTFGYNDSHNRPADTPTSQTGSPQATKFTTATEGDLLVVIGMQSSTSGDILIYGCTQDEFDSGDGCTPAESSYTGGQTWKALSSVNNYSKHRVFYATYGSGTLSNNDETCDANEVCLSYGSSAAGNTVFTHVFDGSQVSSTWSLDTGGDNGHVEGSISGSGVCTTSGRTTTATQTENIFICTKRAINSTGAAATWSDLTSNPIWQYALSYQGSNQVRNTTSYDTSVSVAHLKKATASATGTVSNTPTSASQSGGTYQLISFVDSGVATGYANMVTDYNIVGIEVDDHLRFFETGASDRGCSNYATCASDRTQCATYCPDVNAGHVQRSWFKYQLAQSVAAEHWALMAVETPMFSMETMNYDKWADYDGMGFWDNKYSEMVWYENVDIMEDIFSVGANNNNFEDNDYVQLTSAQAPNPLVSGNSYYIVSATNATFKVSSTLGGAPIDILTQGGGGYHYFSQLFVETASGNCPVDGDYEYVGTFNIKPGAINAPNCPPYDKTCTTLFEVGRQSTLVEEDVKTDMDSMSEWYYDATNDRVYMCYGHDRSVDEYPVLVFKPEFWERSAKRKYMVSYFETDNVGFISADRHFCFLDNSRTARDPWFIIGVSQAQIDLGTHNSCRQYKIDGKYAYYQAGMAYVPTYSSHPDFAPERQGAYGIMSVDNTSSKITATLYERDGVVIKPTLYNDNENSWFERSDSDWVPEALGLKMDLQYTCGGCTYGGCDWFNTSDRTELPLACWTESVSPYNSLQISSSVLNNATDNTTGIAIYITPTTSISQYGQIKITSTSTDGDVGMILRSPESTGNRYALVYDEGAQAIKWQRYNWNTPGNWDDANLKAQWLLDTGGLATDSKSTNTLTNSGVAEETTNKKQGTGSGLFTASESDYLYVTDANLASGFPLKNGDSNKVISVCYWARMNTLPASSAYMSVWAKWTQTSTNRRTLASGIYNDAGTTYWNLRLGYSAGTLTESISHATAVSTGTWYHVTMSYQNSDKSYAIRIRDTNGDVVGTDLTGTATLDALTVFDQAVGIGAQSVDETPNRLFDGYIDEVMVFNKVLTADEATMIAKQTIDSVTVNLAPNTWLSATIIGTGASTTIRVWVDTDEPCNSGDTDCPYSVDRWNNATDAPTYTLTCSGTCAADSGTYAGIIIKDETGVASPTLDDFYSGDAGSIEMFSTGIMRGIMRGIFK